MALIHWSKSNIEPLRGREGFTAADLQLPAEHMNAANISLSIPYPETGWRMNTESEMIVRITEGRVHFAYKGGGTLALSAGDTILVEKNKPYRWVPDHTVHMFVVSSPAWTPEQQIHIPE